MSEIVQFEKIVPEGNALGRKDGKVIFCAGVLPGELAEVELSKDKKSYAQARLIRILEQSPERVHDAEDHALVCSPWQSVDYDYQLELKSDMLMEAFAQQKIKIMPPEIVKSPNQLGFRNRLDFVIGYDDEVARLAFHSRGSANDLVELPEGCKLGSDFMNKAALAIVTKITELGIDNALELTIRQSTANDNVLAWLTVAKKRTVDYGKLKIAEVHGLVITLPATAPKPSGKIIFEVGTPWLLEQLGGKDIAYPFDGFFQTNIPVFRKALDDILAAVPDGANVVELYAGAGAIGLPVALKAAKVIAVEVGCSSIEYAKRNADSSQITNYESHASLSESVDEELLASADSVIVDPPRSGLNSKLIDKLLAAKPKQIIYLSCNPITQARDLAQLLEVYKLSDLTAYDFYPGTPHLESLAVLERK